MSVPMSHEDLQKLKAFIDFVSANPTILNQPALDFVKKFIEKFGGKVPEGEYEIPAGGKCPFGGAATGEKKEPPSQPAAESDSSDESEEAEMDFEPESELELDMDAYSNAEDDDNDDDSVEATKLRQRRKRRATKRITAKNTRPKRKKTAKTKKQQRKNLKQTIKTEPDSDIDMDAQQPANDDPLSFTQQRKNLSARIRRSCQKNEYVYDENILSAKKPVKQATKATKKPRALICFENCKYKCNLNFDVKQRRLLCTEFWSLNELSRDDYLRKSIKLHKTKRLCLQKTERPRREFMCRYFLRAADGQERGVCSVFYMATLALKPSRVKIILAAIWQQQQLAIKQDQSMHESINEECLADELPLTVEIQTQRAVESIITQTPSKSETVRRKLDLSRKLRPINCEALRCRFNCTSKFSEEQRSKLCAAFWALDFKRRKDYLISHVQSFAIVTKTLPEFMKSNRPRSYQNHFFLRNERGENVRVCSRFFTATLSLGSNYISRTLRRSDPNTGTYIGDDMRGRKEPYNKTSPELREDVKRHIESYPTWVPNKRSKTSYLHSSLSVQKMFNEYKEKCLANDRKFVNSTYFRRVFREDFRLAFLRPNVVSPQKIGTAQRNTNADGSEKVKKIKAPNAFLSDYTGEEGGFWSATTELIELESPIKEVTVTTTIERSAVYQPQNVIYTTEADGAVDDVADGSGDNDVVPEALIRFTNLTTPTFVQQMPANMPNMQNLHILQTQQHSDHQHTQQLVLHDQLQQTQQQQLQLSQSTVQQLSTSGLITAQYEAHEGDVYHPMM